MIRKIIEIDREKCNGCGLCVSACHEGAIGLEGGKAKLLRDDYCDGLGNCLPACPAGAIGFVEREAAAYDADAVEQNMHAAGGHAVPGGSAVPPLACGCPGTNAKKIVRPPEAVRSPKAGESSAGHAVSGSSGHQADGEKRQSCLGQWPVQIRLVPVNAPYFEGASLLIAADCGAYAYADFHAAFMRNRITIIGCPKLDDVDYTEKLTAILKTNNIKSVVIVRMEVPCCGGIAKAAIAALKESGKMIPWRLVTLGINGEIVQDE